MNPILRRYGKIAVAFVTLAFMTVMAFATLFFTACGDQTRETVYYVYPSGSTSGGSSSDDGSDGDASTAPGEVSGLVIPLSDFGTTAKFYRINVDGTEMEIIAVKYGASYRTAFNTCQVCYGSPLAYFKQSGNKLVCQNCKNSFSMAEVGVNLGGCAPYPIFESDRVQTEDAIIIPDDFLIGCKNIFKNWTGGY